MRKQYILRLRVFWIHRWMKIVWYFLSKHPNLKDLYVFLHNRWFRLRGKIYSQHCKIKTLTTYRYRLNWNTRKISSSTNELEVTHKINWIKRKLLLWILHMDLFLIKK